MKILRSVATTFLAATFLSSCAMQLPTPSVLGASATDTRARLGAPAKIDQVDSGQRWQYDAGPDAIQAFFVHIDNKGYVRGTEALRSEAKFSLINAGMTRDEVVAQIGHPPKRHSIARDRGYVWSYRSFSTLCIWFQVEFSPEDIVRSTGYNRRPTGAPCR